MTIKCIKPLREQHYSVRRQEKYISAFDQKIDAKISSRDRDAIRSIKSYENSPLIRYYLLKASHASAGDNGK